MPYFQQGHGSIHYTWWGPSVFNAPICATEVINDCPLDNLQNFRPTWIRTHVVRNFCHQVAGKLTDASHYIHHLGHSIWNQHGMTPTYLFELLTNNHCGWGILNMFIVRLIMVAIMHLKYSPTWWFFVNFANVVWLSLTKWRKKIVFNFSIMGATVYVYMCKRQMDSMVFRLCIIILCSFSISSNIF